MNINPNINNHIYPLFKILNGLFKYLFNIFSILINEFDVLLFAFESKLQNLLNDLDSPNNRRMVTNRYKTIKNITE